MRRVPLRVLIALALLATTDAEADVTLERVPELQGSANTHALSGDGRRVVFTTTADPVGRNADGNHEVFVYDVATNTVAQITQTSSQPHFLDHDRLRVSFDGRRVVFQSAFALHAGGARLAAGKDLFLVEFADATTLTSVTVKRLTSTDERGAFTMSPDGSRIVLASRHNLAGANPFGRVQLFQITLSPTVSVSQLTRFDTGVADTEGDVELTTSYDGREVAFTSNRNPSPPNRNGDGSREIFRIDADGVLRQATESIASVRHRHPNLVDIDPAPGPDEIVYLANADPVGQNGDRNVEMFRRRLSDGSIQQITHTTGGDSGFGGANDDLDVSTSGALTLVSNRDLLPANAGRPGNADQNREIFAGALFPTETQLTQVTNSANPSPGSRIENVYPRTSSDGSTIAFNSDLDLGVPGTSILYVADLGRPAAGSSPTISGFSPAAGGPGVPVTLYGDALASATAVRFGTVDALGFQVISNWQVLALAPRLTAEAPITTVTPHGTATSVAAFRPAQFRPHGTEFNQGVVSYPGIAGKDALVRLFTTVTEGAFWISDAQLTITQPSGTQVTVPASLDTPLMTNTAVSHEARHNLNFYVPGALLAAPGPYDFRPTVTTVEGSFQPLGTSTDIRATKDVTLIFQTLFRHPDESEWRSILLSFAELSRVHPIRSRVGDLAGALGATEFEAGLRTAYFATPLWDQLDPTLDRVMCGGPVGTPAGGYAPGPSCWAQLLYGADDRRLAVNSGGFEETELSTVFMVEDRLLTFSGEWTTCATDQWWVEMVAHGYSIESAHAAWVLLCEMEPYVAAAGTFAHEISHLMGVVRDGAANSDGGGHSFNRSMDERGFNVPLRFAVPEPRVLMDPIASLPETKLFLESRSAGQPLDYPWLAFDSPRALQFSVEGNGSARSMPAASPLRVASTGDLSRMAQTARPPAAEPPHPDAPRFVWMAALGPEDLVVFRHAYVAAPGRTAPLPNSKSGLDLVFLDAQRKPLGTAALAPSAADKQGWQNLSAIVPLPAESRAVELRRGDRVLYRLAPGARLPRVQAKTRVATNASGRRVDVTWQAADPDGDRLTFDVSYAPDGKHFQPVAGSTRETRLRLDIDALPAGPSPRLRVTASDGLARTSADVGLPKPPEHAPVVAIVSPRNGTTFRLDETIPLSGLAHDLEEGLLEGAASAKAFSWILDGRRAVANAGRATLSAVGAGPHTLTLRVTDRSGRAGEHTVHFEVTPPPLPPLRRPAIKPVVGRPVR